MRFKKLRFWTKEEDDIIKKYFFSLPHKFSSHQGSRFEKINEILKQNKFTDRTEKAISRRSYRLGLRSIVIKNEELIDTNCSDCSKKIEVKKRYFIRNTQHKCKECQDKKERLWYKTKRSQEYHRHYNKTHKL